MGNCIISKLGGSVDNDELLQLGDVRLYVKSMADAGYGTEPDAHKFLLKFFTLEEEPYMEIIGDGYFTDSTMSQNLGKTMIISSTGNITYYVSDGDYEIIIHTKYGMQRIDIYSLNNMYSSLCLDCGTIRNKLSGGGNYCRIAIYGVDNIVGEQKNMFVNSISSFIFYRDQQHIINLDWLAEPSLKCKDTIYEFNTSGIFLIGKLSSFNNLPSLKTVIINSDARFNDPTKNAITGDLSEFNPISDTSGLTSISIRSCSLVTGDLSSLNRFSALTSLNLSSTAQLTGRLESFLDAVHANGRTSGTMTVNISGTAITYNNAPLSAQKTVTFSASGWTLA